MINEINYVIGVISVPKLQCEIHELSFIMYSNAFRPREVANAAKKQLRLSKCPESFCFGVNRKLFGPQPCRKSLSSIVSVTIAICSSSSTG